MINIISCLSIQKTPKILQKTELERLQYTNKVRYIKNIQVNLQKAVMCPYSSNRQLETKS